MPSLKQALFVMAAAPEVGPDCPRSFCSLPTFLPSR
jgi:hypothetical protein